jgi:phosphoribosylaminoimidazole carboxylase (NCAIR synthetase)
MRIRHLKSRALLEKLVDIDKEIAVMVARDQAGNTAVYPPVEMVFDPKYNLVDMLVSPADLQQDRQQRCSVSRRRSSTHLALRVYFQSSYFWIKKARYSSMRPRRARTIVVIRA